MAYTAKVHKEGPDKLVFESGSTLEIKSGATATVADGTLAVADVALADGKIMVGNASGKGAAVDMSGDATISNAGVVAIGTGVIINTDVKSDAAIAWSKMAALTSAHLLVGSSGNVATDVAVTGDVSISNAGVTAIGSGVIINDDVKSDAAVAWSKMAALSDGNILVGSAGNVATAVAMSGDVTITNAGVTAIGSGVIINDDVKSDAAIAWSKMAALTDANILVGSAGNVATAVAMSGDVTIINTGATAIGSDKVTRTMLKENALDVFGVRLETLRGNDLSAVLPTAGDGSTLGIVAGTHGSASPTLQGSAASGDVKTETVRFSFILPPNYVAAGDVKVRVFAGVLVGAATVSTTLDCEAYEADGAAGISADICATAAQDINSLTPANKDFTITATNLVAGDTLDIQLTTVATDTGGTVGTKALIGRVQLLLDVK